RERKIKNIRRTIKLKSGLVIIFFIFPITISRVQPNFFVIFLQCSKILPGFGEFTLLHTFTDIPAKKCTLGVHQIELVVETSPSLCDSGRVAQHADCSLN
uniref:Uncharacterized protein n=1 Tax=Ciona savignyi TaxID=51511 RepID=H2Z7F2_CIOSA